MENITVIIERNNDGSYTAVPQHKHKIGFIGMGKTVGEAMDDLKNSYSEAKEMLPSLPEMEFTSSKTVQRIQEGITRFSEELRMVCLV